MRWAHDARGCVKNKSEDSARVGGLVPAAGLHAGSSVLRIVQVMPMDGDEAPRHDAGVLGDAIRKEMSAAGVKAAELAQRLGVAESTVSRLAAGLVQDVSVDRLVQIEAALGLPRGRLFRSAGLVDDPTGETVRERLEGDPALSAAELRIVLRVYDSAVDASREERRVSSSRTAPSARSKRRS